MAITAPPHAAATKRKPGASQAQKLCVGLHSHDYHDYMLTLVATLHFDDYLTNNCKLNAIL